MGRIRSAGQSFPPSNISTNTFASVDTRQANDQFTLTIQIPKNADQENYEGAIQISVKPRSFEVDGNPQQTGPEYQQYLGTVYYGKPVPQLEKVDMPDQLVVGDNEILLDWNTPVKGVTKSAFRFDGIFEDSVVQGWRIDIYYADNANSCRNTLYYRAVNPPETPPVTLIDESNKYKSKIFSDLLLQFRQQKQTQMEIQLKLKFRKVF